jgi:hypothetical protein
MQGDGGADRDDGGGDARNEERANVRGSFRSWTAELSTSFGEDQAVNHQICVKPPCLAA